MYYIRRPELEDMKFVDFVRTYNIFQKLPIFYQNNREEYRNSQANEKHYFEMYLNNEIYAYIYTRNCDELPVSSLLLHDRQYISNKNLLLKNTTILP